MRPYYIMAIVVIVVLVITALGLAIASYTKDTREIVNYVDENGRSTTLRIDGYHHFDEDLNYKELLDRYNKHIGKKYKLIGVSKAADIEDDVRGSKKGKELGEFLGNGEDGEGVTVKICSKKSQTFVNKFRDQDFAGTEANVFTAPGDKIARF